MADVFIHQLPDSAPLSGAEFVVLSQGGVAKKATALQVAALNPVAVGPEGPEGPTGPGGPSTITVGATDVSPVSGTGFDVLYQDIAGKAAKTAGGGVDQVLWLGLAGAAPVWSAYIPAFPPNWAGAPASIGWMATLDRLAAWIAANAAQFAAIGIVTQP